MKNIKLEENIPAEVLHIQFASIVGYPLGIKYVTDTITKYPEYFPEEIEYRKKWGLIPQSVHDKYYEKKSDIVDECFKNCPPSLGISGWVGNPEYMKEYERIYQECFDKSIFLLKELHDSLYKEYGIEFIK